MSEGRRARQGMASDSEPSFGDAQRAHTQREQSGGDRGRSLLPLRFSIKISLGINLEHGWGEAGNPFRPELDYDLLVNALDFHFN